MTYRDPNVSGNRSPARRPGCLWYLLAIPIFLVGLYFAIGLMSVVIFKDDNVDADFANVPGDKDLFLRKIGVYYIVSDKQQTVVSGDTSSRGEPTDILVTVRSRANGQAMTLLREAGKDDQTGRTTLTFNVAQMGNFRVTAAYRNGASGPAARLMVTSGFTTESIVKMTMAGVMLVVGLVGPVVFVAYIAAKRSRRRNV